MDNQIIKSRHPAHDTYIGLDYGEARIGIAFGRLGLVCPIKTISSVNQLTAINEICKVAIENRATKIILGVPLTYDHKDTPKARVVRNFAKKLKIFLKRPVEFVNEYKSSEESMHEAISFGISKRGRQHVDHISAGIILKRYFANHAQE